MRFEDGVGIKMSAGVHDLIIWLQNLPGTNRYIPYELEVILMFAHIFRLFRTIHKGSIKEEASTGFNLPTRLKKGMSYMFKLPWAKGDKNLPRQESLKVSVLPQDRSLDEDIWDDYLVWFYQGNVWKRMSWHGIRTLKLPSDMWNYQEIIHDLEVEWVIEAGTRHGGSALFFAESLVARKAKGKVISIDIDDSARKIESHPTIEFIIGDTGSPEIVKIVASMLPESRGTVFIILDSDHAQSHVTRELEVWVPFLKSGDYLVVEDSAINGHPVRPDFGPGPYEAIQQYLAAHPGELRHDIKRERKFGATQAPMGYFLKT